MKNLLLGPLFFALCMFEGQQLICQKIRFQEGRIGALNGIQHHQNPYRLPLHFFSAYWWEQGWRQGIKEQCEKIPRKIDRTDRGIYKPRLDQEESEADQEALRVN